MRLPVSDQVVHADRTPDSPARGRADFDGYIAELLSKALSQAQLDQPLTNDDRDKLLAYLRRLGALDQQRVSAARRAAAVTIRGGHGAAAVA